jgi:hypothetical protein
MTIDRGVVASARSLTDGSRLALGTKHALHAHVLGSALRSTALSAPKAMWHD